MRHALMLLLAAALLVVACALVGPAPEPGPAVPGRTVEFPHAVHLSDDVGLSCVDCHAGAEEEERAGMPSFTTCVLCHTVEDEGAPEGALSPVLTPFLLDGATTPSFSRLTASNIPITFSHAAHVGAGVDCASCHGDLTTSEAVTAAVHVNMANCLDCHQSRGVEEGGCLACHAGVDERWKPATHDFGWERAHGRVQEVVGLRAGNPAMDCGLCHREDGPIQSCAECHLSALPEDHTPFFKNQGHGLIAAMNRNRCQACHQEDTCLECHAVTEPISHGANWGAPRNQHCLNCHLGARASGDCRVCHVDGAPSHDLAPTPPPTVAAHATATACMTCHATVRPPNHPYTGDGNYCRRCHQ